MKIEEMLQEVNGKTADNIPKGGFSLMVDMWKIDGNRKTKDEEIRTVRNIILCKPELSIQKHGKYVQVDIIFMSPVDRDLESLWKAMEYYGQLLDQVDESAVEVPVATLTITSAEWEGYFHMVGINPVMWTLQPRKPAAPVSTLRIIFTNEYFFFYEDENLNLSEVRAETARDIERMEEEITMAEIEKAKTERKNMVD